MTENTINVEMERYTNAANLSMQCLGVLPQSINGHSPTTLIKVVYPNEDYEEVFMDLVTRQNHVSHGYKLKLDNVNISTSYIPWRKMFAGSAVLTIDKEDIDKEEAIVEEIKKESFKTDPPMSPIYLLQDGKLVLISKPAQTDTLKNLSNNDTPKSNSSLLTNGSTNNNIGGAILFALGFVAALGIVSLLKRQ